MVGFVTRRCLHALAQLGRPRSHRLRLVQSLGADFADVVDAHQRAGRPALSLREFARAPVHRIGAGGGGVGEDGAQAAIDRADEVVQG